jgi:hypothetical protein
MAVDFKKLVEHVEKTKKGHFAKVIAENKRKITEKKKNEKE